MTSPGDQVGDALAELERLYSDGLEQHGASSRSVGWKDAASHALRFAKLAQLLPRRSAEPVTVNDLGCGYGSLFSFLDELPGVRLAGYYGYDISDAMLEQARSSTDSRACLVRSAQPTHVADYGFACGPFHVKGTATDAAWQAYVQDTVLRLAATSRLGFAFNLLTTFVDFKKAHLFYGDPCAFFQFCKREISPDVTLLHDYPLYEWTMLVRHRP